MVNSSYHISYIHIHIIFLKYFTDDLPGGPGGGLEVVAGGERGEADHLSERYSVPAVVDKECDRQCVF